MTIWQAGVLALLSFQAAAQGPGPIRLKAREIDPRAPSGAVKTRRTAGGLRHSIVQFRSYPGPELREELARRNIRVLSYVPESALMVSGREPLDLEGLDVTWSGPLEASDKLSPGIEVQEAGAYLVVFHSDADMEAARAMVRGRGFEVLENPWLGPDRLLVTGASVSLRSLAGRDAVAYVMPATPDLAARRHVLWCGGPLAEAGPVAEYALVGTGWAKDSSGRVALQYAYQSLTTKVASNAARSEIERAFAEWARYGNVTFAPAAAVGVARSIDISFASGAHGDGYPFDGPGGVLAHTFYPAPGNPEPLAGNMHFDADEAWGVGSGTDLFSVALHEAGHALGLGHSSTPGTVMYPYYSLATGLTDDDIAGVRALYGAAGATPSEPAQPAPPNTPAPPTQPAQPAQPAQPSQPAQPTPPAGGGDTTAPSLQILSPSLTIVATSAATIAVSGTAGDDVGVASVAWATSNGDAGAAAGTTRWSATVPLLVGNNTVTIRAFDAAGNSAWRAINVVRR